MPSRLEVFFPMGKDIWERRGLEQRRPSQVGLIILLLVPFCIHMTCYRGIASFYFSVQCLSLQIRFCAVRFILSRFFRSKLLWFSISKRKLLALGLETGRTAVSFLPTRAVAFLGPATICPIGHVAPSIRLLAVKPRIFFSDRIISL